MVEVLNALYGTDFLGFSYGFRPERSQHNALDALYAGLLARKVNWVLDLDIRGFFDTLDHGWLVKFIEHRVADRRLVRLIQKWLNTGVCEDGKRKRVEKGTPQGGSLAQLLANIVLHELDVYLQQQKRSFARYADDFVICVKSTSAAQRVKANVTRSSISIWGGSE